MADSQGLFDALAGASGHGIDRAGLNNFVATSQARNGLVSAQTQDALLKAQQAQEELEAHAKVSDQLADIYPDMKPSERELAKSALIGALGGSSETATKALGLFAAGHGNPQQQAMGLQQASGKPLDPAAVPNNYMAPPGGVYQNAPIQQSPQGAAQTAETNALAGLNTHKNQDPAAFRAQVFGNTSPDGIAAITKAVQEGRLDPTRVNSRTAPILAQMEQANPGTNYNRLHADANLQSNATFQQRANGLEIMPGILQHVTQLGKALDNGAGYSDLRTVGKMQQFMNGETNDPAYAEYMPVRNDALLRLAYLMRGQGASDMANKTESEAFAPTLAPYALDAWLKGQMSVLKPMIDKNSKIVHLGEAGQGTQPLASPTATPAPQGSPSLGDTVPTIGSPTPASYPTEAAALAAGHKIGDRVIIGGVAGTLR